MRAWKDTDICSPVNGAPDTITEGKSYSANPHYYVRFYHKELAERTPSLRFGLNWDTKIDKVGEVVCVKADNMEYSVAFPKQMFDTKPLASELPGYVHTYSYQTGEGTKVPIKPQISSTQGESQKGKDEKQAKVCDVDAQLISGQEVAASESETFSDTVATLPGQPQTESKTQEMEDEDDQYDEDDVAELEDEQTQEQSVPATELMEVQPAQTQVTSPPPQASEEMWTEEQRKAHEARKEEDRKYKETAAKYNAMMNEMELFYEKQKRQMEEAIEEKRKELRAAKPQPQSS